MSHQTSSRTREAIAHSKLSMQTSSHLMMCCIVLTPFLQGNWKRLGLISQGCTLMIGQGLDQAAGRGDHPVRRASEGQRGGERARARRVTAPCSHWVACPPCLGVRGTVSDRSTRWHRRWPGCWVSMVVVVRGAAMPAAADGREACVGGGIRGWAGGGSCWFVNSGLGL